MKIFIQFSAFIFCMILVPIAAAGDRGIEIGIVNITKGEQSKECKRLYELLQMDIEYVFIKDPKAQFGWNPVGSKLRPVSATALTGVFGPMITVKKAAGINDLCEKNEIWDGLIVFEYDKGAMKVRLKLFDNTGRELALIKLPLEKNGAMKNSLLKHVRRGAVGALASCVKFNP